VSRFAGGVSTLKTLDNKHESRPLKNPLPRRDRIGFSASSDRSRRRRVNAGHGSSERHSFSYVRPDSRVPPNHPLRPIRRITDIALASLSDRFDAMYSEIGRPSFPPEKLLRALLLRAFYSIPSEGQLMEQMEYNLLFRWFVGLSVDEPVWVPTVFSKTGSGCWRAKSRRPSWTLC
jgi:hypothetical protein